MQRNYINFVRRFQPLFFLRHPLLDPADLSFLKSLVSSPLFSVPPSFKVFQTVPPTLTKPPSYPNLTHQPSLHLTGGFKMVILPVQLSLSITNQVLIFEIPLQIYQVILILNLWDIFNFIFRQLRMTFFIKL